MKKVRALIIPLFLLTNLSVLAQVTKLTGLDNFSVDRLTLGFGPVSLDDRGLWLAAYGIGFKGEAGSKPTHVLFIQLGDMLPDFFLRNDPPPGETSAGKALVVQFQRPVRRAAFRPGNGTPETTAQIQAFTSAAKSLGTIEHDEIPERNRIGTYVGVETSSPEGISIIVIDYGQDERAEQIHGIAIDYLEKHAFVQCIPQIGDGRAAGRRLSSILAVQSLFATQTVVVRFFTSDGQPLVMPLQNGENAHSLELELGPEGMSSFRTEGSSEPAVVGYACVESVRPVVAHAIFRTIDESTSEIQEASIRSTAGKSLQVLTVEFDRGTGLDTGLALVNQGQAAASVRFHLSEGLDPTNGIRLNKRVIIPAGGHLPIFLSEIFRSFFEKVDRPFEGSVRISSEQPIVAVAVRTIDGFPVSSLPSGSWEETLGGQLITVEPANEE